MAIANYLDKLVELKDTLNNRLNELTGSTSNNKKIDEIINEITNNGYLNTENLVIAPFTRVTILDSQGTDDIKITDTIINNLTETPFRNIRGFYYKNTATGNYTHTKMNDSIPLLNNIRAFYDINPFIDYSTCYLPKSLNFEKALLILNQFVPTNQVYISWNGGDDGLIADVIDNITNYVSSSPNSFQWWLEMLNDEHLEIIDYQKIYGQNYIYMYPQTELIGTVESFLSIINISYIGSYAFQFRIGLFFIHLSTAVEEIGEGAFSYCQSINGVNLSSIKRINNYAFYNGFCKNRLHLQKNWGSIDDGDYFSFSEFCLYHMTNPIELILTQIQYIGDYAFWCNNSWEITPFQYIYFGGSLTFNNIGEYIFNIKGSSTNDALSDTVIRLNSNLLSTSFIKDANGNPCKIKCKALLLPPVESIPTLTYYSDYEVVIIDGAITDGNSISSDAFKNASSNLKIYVYDDMCNIPSNKWRGSESYNNVTVIAHSEDEMVVDDYINLAYDGHYDDDLFPTFDALKYYFDIG